DRREVEGDDFRVVDVAGLWNAVQTLGLEVRRERIDLHGGAAGGREVIDGGDRRAVGNGERGRAFAKELDELADHLFLAQQFRDRQHEIGGGDSLVEA